MTELAQGRLKWLGQQSARQWRLQVLAEPHHCSGTGESNIPSQTSDMWEQQGGTGISYPGTKCTSGNFEKEQKVKKTIPTNTTPEGLPAPLLFYSPWAAICSSVLCTNSLPAILEPFNFFFYIYLLFCQSLKCFSQSCLAPETAGGDCFELKQDIPGERKVSFSTWSWLL